jgi:putative transposase
MDIFLDDWDHRQFEFLLGEVVMDYGVECWGFCEMSNHYHAILRPTKANFSEAIRILNGDYAQWWNKRHNRVGHTFQGRFKDQIVDTDKYLMALIRYVARNPLRAGLVKDLANWRFGSYRALAGLENSPPLLSVEPVLAQFGIGDVGTLQERFKAFVLGDEVDPVLEDRIRSNDRVLGDQAFKQRILGRATESSIATPPVESTGAEENCATGHSAVGAPSDANRATWSDPGLTPV